jgi:excisionase family DNA binding protein
MDQLLTVPEAAAMLRMTPGGVRKWISQRKLPVVRLGRLVRLRPSDLAALVAQGVRPARPPAA